MRPQNWNPPLELSEAEAKIISKIRKAKLFIWLRKNRHLLFDEQFQKELALSLQRLDGRIISRAPCPISLNHYLTSLLLSER